MSEKARTTGTLAALGLNEVQVVAYLRGHPDFLLRNRDLFDTLALPARDFGASTAAPNPDTPAGDVGQIVDLQQYMLAHFKNEIRKRDVSFDSLIDTGRDNMQSQNRAHAAVLALHSARSLDHLLEVIGTDLPVLLELDVATLCLENGEVACVSAEGIRVLPAGLIDDLMGPRRDVLLAEAVNGDPRLYGEAVGLVRSAAYLRLRVRAAAPHALLALGSRDDRRFHPGQGTELLAFVAKVVTHTIRTWLDLPR